MPDDTRRLDANRPAPLKIDYCLSYENYGNWTEQVEDMDTMEGTPNVMIGNIKSKLRSAIVNIQLNEIGTISY